MPLDIRPEFQVEKVTGKFQQPVTRIEQDVKHVGIDGERKIITNKMVHEMRTVEEGYMIYFPQGHSMFVPVDDTDQLERIGVFRDPRSIEMSSGEEVPDEYALTPKEIVARKERNRPRPRNVGGLTDIEQEV